MNEHGTSATIVRKGYAAPDKLDEYRIVGLWPAEERLVERYFTPGGTLLDIGCGAGRTSIPLAEKGFQVTAIDLTPEMIDAARIQAEEHEQLIDFRVMNASSLSFDDASFADVLFSFNGYEHVPEDGQHGAVLAEAFRVLRPGGHFILTSRSGVAFGRRWAAWAWMLVRHLLLRPLGLASRELGWGDMVNKEGYFHYRSPFYIRRLLRLAGFKPVLFNSRRNIEAGRDASFFTNFSADICLFFVARKPDREWTDAVP
jgi:ubiquinone/menaquinone biosynthesis C-methylase UbiE